ncbi:uncharacterized protein BDR25DRAFT_310723 [Lindgomyces ingoldianus]|uniref:Uncharacterized protein n=1 Tax=Lindgomyces ingoldianus TaxID=673940 RepID=A0ACB6R7R8_9PLEO|nr:uncharacterized protein BDR25DRAFT_310723 [Lindgomyces ingoldianus]KAF2475318.1 hypothetical protein BDR25DRAFT_310723 [Lindgomyces ingoldianus]
MPPLLFYSASAPHRTSAVAAILLLFLLLTNITFAANLSNPADVASSLRARQTACKALKNCPPSPQKKVLDDLPWNGVPQVRRPRRKRSGVAKEPARAEKRARRAGSLSAHLVPLPTIETMMTYPSLPRPLYDSLVRGDPPAQSYNTIIHTPKPPHMRTLDQNLIRAAEISALRRKNRSRSRSSTNSSVAGSVSGYSASSNSVYGDESSSSSDVSEPTSPASVSSSAKATIASSPARSPTVQLPLSGSPTLSTSTEDSIIDSYSTPHSQDPSPAQSFHSSLSALSALCDSASSLSAPSSSRSSAPSPASSAYPSPPTTPSPENSRRSSSSGEEFMYPSPPPSPGPAAYTQGRTRERRAFTFPVAPSPPPHPLSQGQDQDQDQPPFPKVVRTTSMSSHPTRSRARSKSFDPTRIPLSSEEEFDIGGQQLRLGGGSMYDDDEDMEWSFNGGSIVFGAAGLAVSPRAMMGCCCDCGGEGLGLYVIDEVDEGSEEAGVES